MHRREREGWAFLAPKEVPLFVAPLKILAIDWLGRDRLLDAPKRGRPILCITPEYVHTYANAGEGVPLAAHDTAR